MTTTTASARLAVATGALALVGTLAGPAMAATGGASTSGSAAASTSAASVISTSSLLRLEDVKAAGLRADTGTIDATGMVPIGDAGRYDGCLGEKSIRNMTNAKAYPVKNEALGFYGTTLSSTLDKESWVLEAITQAPDAKRAAHYASMVKMSVANRLSCSDDPATSHRYRAPRTFTANGATVTIWVDEAPDGTSNGGGTALVQRGTKMAVIDLLRGRGHAGDTLGALATTAAKRLGQ